MVVVVVVVGAAGVLDVAEAVASVAAAVIGGPAEVLLVEIFAAAAVAPSSLSTLTCANCTVGCAALRCLLKFEVLPPWVDKSLLQILHLALVAEISPKWFQMSLLFLPLIFLTCSDLWCCLCSNLAPNVNVWGMGGGWVTAPHGALDDSSTQFVAQDLVTPSSPHCATLKCDEVKSCLMRVKQLTLFTHFHAKHQLTQAVENKCINNNVNSRRESDSHS